MLVALVADGLCVCISLSGYVVSIALVADGLCVCISLSGYVVSIALVADGLCVCISLSGYVVPIASAAIVLYPYLGGGGTWCCSQASVAMVWLQCSGPKDDAV